MGRTADVENGLAWGAGYFRRQQRETSSAKGEHMKVKNPILMILAPAAMVISHLALAIVLATSH